MDEILINKKTIETAIGDTIAVIYKLSDNVDCYFNNNTRTAIKPDNEKNYTINKNYKYLIISAKSFYSIANGKLTKIHCFS